MRRSALAQSGQAATDVARGFISPCSRSSPSADGMRFQCCLGRHARSSPPRATLCHTCKAVRNYSLRGPLALAAQAARVELGPVKAVEGRPALWRAPAVSGREKVRKSGRHAGRQDGVAPSRLRDGIWGAVATTGCGPRRGHHKRVRSLAGLRLLPCRFLPPSAPGYGFTFPHFLATRNTPADSHANPQRNRDTNPSLRQTRTRHDFPHLFAAHCDASSPSLARAGIGAYLAVAHRNLKMARGPHRGVATVSLRLCDGSGL